MRACLVRTMRFPIFKYWFKLFAVVVKIHFKPYRYCYSVVYIPPIF